MHPKFNYAIIGSSLLAFGIYLGTKLSHRPQEIEPLSTNPSKSAQEIEHIRSIPKPQAPDPSVPDQAKTPADRINALAQLNDPSHEPQTDIRIIEHLFGQVRTVFHELPSGDHQEIVAFLRGKNPRAIEYLPADDPNLNDEGEIVDRWGTPFFFHALSRHRIEVRSAGPDQIHWSGDDIVSESQDAPAT
ncbi:hypothetical protein QEH56_03750 [Pelagicoccus enzymogenes]|uniref:hypothetical protein n=1 Tax=Pelagicoccus enzymogenes TaxID=2773457 RepID=UPI00280CA15F|nr:hypothetical protein [Pelagicoccus enzymogenes]MDQ8197244.1 hypothetical protein [Pelagicoccus enzymogenes]